MSIVSTIGIDDQYTGDRYAKCGHPADEFNDPTYSDGSVNAELAAWEQENTVKSADAIVADELRDALNWIGQFVTAERGVTVSRNVAASIGVETLQPVRYIAMTYTDGCPCGFGETAIAACIALLAKLDRKFKADLVA